MNFFKTSVLLAGIVGLFIGVGYLVGGTGGMLIALVLGVAMNFGMYFAGKSLALGMSKAQPLPEGDVRFSWLAQANKQLCEKAGIPEVPLYLSPDPQPNAFACGRGPGNSAVCLNIGLIENMSQREVIGVLAHELGHIKNRDTLTMTIAAAVGSAITSLTYFAMFFGGDRENRSNPLVALLVMLLAPIAATLIQMAVSRSREYGADAFAAKLIGNGDDLADALQTLERGTASVKSLTAQPTMAHMYIANPFSAGGLAQLFSTHPPIPERVARLRAFHQGLAA